MAEIRIDRTGLGLGVLSIPTFPDGNFWIDEDGLTEPEFEWRTTFADDSGHTSGSLPVQAVRALGAWQAVVYVRGADAAALKANRRALEAAVGQFSFATELTTIGAPDTYSCFAGRVSWGSLDSGMVAGLISRAAVTVPCLPLVGA